MDKDKCCWEESIEQEIAEIQKYCSSECKRQGHDVDPQCLALDWVEKNAAKFRQRWEKKRRTSDD